MKSIYSALYTILLLAIALFNIPIASSQNQVKMKQTALVIPKITPEFEKLDTLEYLQIKEENESYGEKIFTDGSSIYINKKEDIYIQRYHPTVIFVL